MTPVISVLSRVDIPCGESMLQIEMSSGMSTDCNLMSVSFGGVDCPVATCDSTLIECSMPALAAGTSSVVVTHPDDGSAASGSLTIDFRIDDFSPTTSGLSGGAPLYVNGEGMSVNEASISVCGADCAVDVARSTANRLVCTLPVVDSNVACDIVVTDPSQSRKRRDGSNLGSISFDDSLTASITGVDSSNGKIRGGTGGGTLLTLHGEGFNADVTANQVDIDGSDCAVEVATETEIVCRTSSHSGSGFFDINLDVNGVGLFTAATQFRYVNAWSSPATWGCSSGTLAECAGAPNTDGDLVEIGPGNDVLLDVSTVILSALLIRGGSLTWDTDVDGVHLQAEYIIIVDGSFTLGTETEPMMNQARITLYGHHRSIHLPIYGAKVFAVRSGTVDIHGAPVSPTWTFLEETAEAGATSIKIQTPNGLTGWNIGDRIAIAPTGGSTSIIESEDVVITGIIDNGDGTHNIDFDTALSFLHTGTQTFWPGFNGETITLNQRAEVGLLSRNIKFEGSKNPSPWYDTIPTCAGSELDLGIESVQNCFVDRFNDEEGSDKFGAHMIFHNIEYAKIEFMEIHHCGQLAELGRYPIHFHNSYDQPDSYFRGLGIWQTFNRAMTLHAVNFAMIEDNVAYNNMGHAYFMEDAVEHDNTVRNNLAIKTKIASSLLSVDATPACFWIVNPNNRYYGNHAAGCAGFGFWLNPPAHSTGSNADSSFCPREIPILEFRDNSAHSCGIYGMWIFEEYHPRKNNINGKTSSSKQLQSVITV